MLENILYEHDIEEIIPHRKPFRFVDEIREVEFGKRAVGLLTDLKHSDFSWLHPQLLSSGIIPLPLLLEAFAEVGAVVVLGLPENRGKIGVLARADIQLTGAPISPEDQVLLTAELSGLRSNFGRGKGLITVEGFVRATVAVSFGIIDLPSFPT